jgi:hypothetical protein
MAVEKYTLNWDAVRLQSIDVGAHGGVCEHWVPYLERMNVDAFEPNEKDCQIQSKISPPNIRWHAVGLAKTTGSHPLYILNRPTGSSLYPPNEAILGNFSAESYWGLNRIQSIDCLSLSDFLKREGSKLPNLIKLDCQGAELDILSSLEPAQMEDLLCVETEVEFAELYKGQPLFQDLHAFMIGRGFQLFDLRTHRAYRSTSSVDNYYIKTHLNTSQGSSSLSAQLVAGDALYLRNPESPHVLGSREGFLKFLIITQIYHFFDLGLWLIYQAEKRGLLEPAEAAFLIRSLKKSAPRPKIWHRADLLGKITRRFLQRFGFDETYPVFWTRKCWPDQ